jgi:hypothetical protein
LLADAAVMGWAMDAFLNRVSELDGWRCGQGVETRQSG